MEVAPVVPIDPGEVITRLTNEVLAKEKAMSMLKTKTKVFVDNMREQLAGEKKKVSELELRLQQSAATMTSAADDGVMKQQSLSEEIERLEHELEVAALREKDLEAQTQSSADDVSLQLESEKERNRVVALQLQESVGEADSLREDKFKVQAELQTEKEKVQRLEAQLQESVEEAASLREKEIKTLEELQTGKEKAGGLEVQLQEKSEEVGALRENGDKIEAEVQTEQAKTQELTLQLQEMSEETTALRDNELKLKATNDDMTLQLQTEKERVHDLENQLQEKLAATAQHQVESIDASCSPETDTMTEEVTTLCTQCEAAAQEVSSMRGSLQAAAEESSRLRQELELLRTSGEQEQASLQEEVDSMQSREQDLEATIRALKGAQEGLSKAGQLETAIKKHQELEFQLEQHKIENKHLQKQLSDKDFQLEQLEDCMMRAEEGEVKVLMHRGEVATLQSQLHAKCEELAAMACNNCPELEAKLSEMTKLYEKVNMGRSQSDSLLAETQSALDELKTVKQQYAESQEFQSELSKQNEQLKEKVREQDAEVSTLKNELKRWSVDMANLQAQLHRLKLDSSEHHEHLASAAAEQQKAEEVIAELRTRCAQLEKLNQELLASIEVINKENSEKRLKAKALVMSLASEKQHLLDAKNDVQKEVDRLRMELNQRNVENDEHLKKLREETTEKNAQSASTIQNLSDEIASLKKSIATVQESERSQQRAKELATAKREVEDSHKKRLAAKAETQKLAVELESVHKCLDRLSSHVNSNSMESVQKISRLLGHVKDAIHIVEKRSAVAAQADGSQSIQEAQDGAGAEDIRGAKTADGARLAPMSPYSGAKRMEESVSRVTEQLTILAEATERLCDLATEQGDINLKDAIIAKLTQTFAQCFTARLQSAYSKTDENDNFLDPKETKSEGNDADKTKA